MLLGTAHATSTPVQFAVVHSNALVPVFPIFWPPPARFAQIIKISVGRNTLLPLIVMRFQSQSLHLFPVAQPDPNHVIPSWVVVMAAATPTVPQHFRRVSSLGDRDITNGRFTHFHDPSAQPYLHRIANFGPTCQFKYHRDPRHIPLIQRTGITEYHVSIVSRFFECKQRQQQKHHHSTQQFNNISLECRLHPTPTPEYPAHGRDSWNHYRRVLGRFNGNITAMP
ncbi:hypothetical protein B0H12DRAFT_1235718 [Mycena haematopus]|nr:hypothetical protein B0H12DRAFT_1235718 [Mycena haematopus]